MKEDNMYETIMGLLLFKGLSHQQISSFLEKTQLHFLRYPSGSEITRVGDRCDSLRIIFSGNVRICHPVFSGRISVDEICGEGKVLGAEKLFGINPRFTYSVIAETEVNLMEFGKEQYLQMIERDEVFLLNFINYISMRGQRGAEIFRKSGCASISDCLRLLFDCLTDRLHDKIFIRSSIDNLIQFCGLEKTKFEEELSLLEEKGVLVKRNDTLEILSYNLL